MALMFESRAVETEMCPHYSKNRSNNLDNQHVLLCNTVNSCVKIAGINNFHAQYYSFLWVSLELQDYSRTSSRYGQNTDTDFRYL